MTHTQSDWRQHADKDSNVFVTQMRKRDKGEVTPIHTIDCYDAHCACLHSDALCCDDVCVLGKIAIVERKKN